MKIRLFGTQNDSIVDGPGIRYSIFTQGCNHNCEGCHNPGSHDMNGGYISDTDELFEKIKSNPLLDGVTFSGGEPFLQAKALTELAKKIKTSLDGIDIMVYTGYTIDEILLGANKENKWRELLEYVDILVDGRFIKKLRSIDLCFKGSKNQRLIDVRKTLESGKVVLAKIADAA